MAFYSNTYKQTKPPRKMEIKIVDTRENKTFNVKVISWITVTEIKQMIQEGLGIPVTQQRLFIRTQELTKNNSSLLLYCPKGKCVIHIRPPPRLETNTGLIKRYEALPKNQLVASLVMSVQKGFNIGLYPKLTLNGTSGSYLLQNKNRKTAAIFKPFDEEPFAPNNPRGYVGKLGSQGFRPGILSGESALREVAAFLLDENRMYNVPPTTFVEIIHPYFLKDKTTIDVEKENFNMIPVQSENQNQNEKNKEFIIKHGSLQQYIENAEEAGDYGYNSFPDEEVRKIAILDIRILNCDRNEGNILVYRANQRFNLIPIDHGLCLPDNFSICTYEIVWMDWPHVKKSFTLKELQHINDIDPRGDVNKLSKYLKFRQICLRNFRIAETLLKNGAKSGLTLYEIGSILYKEDPDQVSQLEDIVARAEEIYFIKKNSETKNLLWGHKLFAGTNQLNGYSNDHNKNYTNGPSTTQFKNLIDEQNSKDNRQANKSYITSKMILDTSQNSHNNSLTQKNNQSKAGIMIKSGEDCKTEFKADFENSFKPSETGMNSKALLKNMESDIAKPLPLKKYKSVHLKSLNKPDKNLLIKSPNDISEESSDDEEQKDNDDNRLERNPIDSLLKRRLSLPSNRRIHRVNSLPHIINDKNENQSGSQHKQDDKENNGDKEGAVALGKHKNFKMKEYDETFYYYFECLLSQKIEIILKLKKNSEDMSMGKSRQRFMSFDQGMQKNE